MRPTREHEVLHYDGATPGSARKETIVVEEPLEIRLDDRPVATTLRTPGHDLELALGFLVGEGILRDLDRLHGVVHCEDTENVVDVRSRPGAPALELPPARRFLSAAGCGLCGKTTLDQVRILAPGVHEDTTRVTRATLSEIPRTLRHHQHLFEATGALHAAGLFDPSGGLLCVREDVGRHNAVDKVVGWAVMRDLLPLNGHVLFLSGRCGFELVQKARLARIPIVAAISGPSSLAIDLARESGITLVSFVRGDRMSVNTEAWRIHA